MRALISLIVLTLFISCSGKSPTKTGFNLEMGNFAATTAGGSVVVFGANTKGDRFLRVVTSSSLSEEIPKGNWTFGAMAWTGVEPLTGVISCALQKGVDIQSDSATVNLSLSNGTCFNGELSTEAGLGTSEKSALPIEPKFCTTDLSNLSDPSDCTYDIASNVTTKAPLGGYKIGFQGGRTVAGKTTRIQSESLLSECINPDSSGIVPGLNIPAFSPDLRIPLLAIGYLEGCNPEKGIVATSLLDSEKAKFVTTYSSKSLFAKATFDEICSAAATRTVQSPFSSGKGTPTTPYVICSPKDLAYLQANITTHKGDSFTLGRDIDLLSYIKGPAGNTPFSNCGIGEGDTLPPIGFTYDIDCKLLTSVTFTGAFDGNNKTIKYFRFKGENGGVGLFSSVVGKIANLTLSHAEIEGGDNTGIVAGTFSGSLFKNVKVVHSEIEGRGNDIGGLIGSASVSSSLEDVKFEGYIFGDNANQNIGGIVGNSAVDIQRAIASGSISSSGTNIGGVVGSSTASINYARSNMLIKSTRTSFPVYVGGIAGQSGTVNNSFSIGHISISCVGYPNDSYCKIGAISGDGSGSYNANFQNLSSFGGFNGSFVSNFENFYDVLSMNSFICNGTCDWSFNQGVLPRISGLDDDICFTEEGNKPLDEQEADHARGSSAKPYMICKPSQLIEIDNKAGSFELGSHLNISSIGSNIGNVAGNLNGKDFSLYAFNDESDVSSALFVAVESGAQVRNLYLNGFSSALTMPHTGLSCVKSTLSQTNSGTISQVYVENLDVNLNGSGCSFGGIVGTNSGTIKYSYVDGQILGGSNIGGLVATNSGQIVRSQAHIDFSFSGDDVSNVGGIVGTNNGTVAQNSVKGSFNSLGSASTAVGGIVGRAIGGVIRDNHATSNFYVNAGDTYFGGIVGASTSPASIIRNVFHGAMIATGSNPKAIIANGSASTNNISLTTTYKYKGSGTNIQVSPGSEECTVNIPSSDLSIAAETDGMIEVNNRYYGGIFYEYDIVTSNYVFLTNPIEECSSLASNSAIMYVARTSTDKPDIAGLRLSEFSIVDVEDGTAWPTVLAAHMYFFRNGEFPSSAPVWLYGEDPYEYITLFQHD